MTSPSFDYIIYQKLLMAPGNGLVSMHDLEALYLTRTPYLQRKGVLSVIGRLKAKGACIEKVYQNKADSIGRMQNSPIAVILRKRLTKEMCCKFNICKPLKIKPQLIPSFSYCIYAQLLMAPGNGLVSIETLQQLPLHKNKTHKQVMFAIYFLIKRGAGIEKFYQEKFDADGRVRKITVAIVLRKSLGKAYTYKFRNQQFSKGQLSKEQFRLPTRLRSRHKPKNKVTMPAEIKSRRRYLELTPQQEDRQKEMAEEKVREFIKACKIFGETPATLTEDKLIKKYHALHKAITDTKMHVILSKYFIIAREHFTGQDTRHLVKGGSNWDGL